MLLAVIRESTVCCCCCCAACFLALSSWHQMLCCWVLTLAWDRICTAVDTCRWRPSRGGLHTQFVAQWYSILVASCSVPSQRFYCHVSTLFEPSLALLRASCFYMLLVAICNLSMIISAARRSSGNLLHINCSWHMALCICSHLDSPKLSSIFVCACRC